MIFPMYVQVHRSDSVIRKRSVSRDSVWPIEKDRSGLGPTAEKAVGPPEASRHQREGRGRKARREEENVDLPL